MTKSDYIHANWNRRERRAYIMLALSLWGTVLVLALFVNPSTDREEEQPCPTVTHVQ